MLVTSRAGARGRNRRRAGKGLWRIFFSGEVFGEMLIEDLVSEGENSTEEDSP